MKTIRNDSVAVCSEYAAHPEIIEKVRSDLPTADAVMRVSELFKVFGDITRVNILCVLSRSEMCVCDIAVLLGMTQSAISHQLRLLKTARLVKFRRDGKAVYYSLDDDHINEIFDAALRHVSE